jgi:ABC-2 type transport system ATP-binding protein
MQTCLEIKNVSHSYNKGFFLLKNQILDDINLTMTPKTIFGFLGANGSGKTTLINLMTGLRKPKKGSITVLGHCAHSVQARSKIGYLPERPYFQEHLTSAELLLYFGSLAGLSRKTIKARTPRILEEVGLSHTIHTPLKAFSKGMLQRIGIAQAIIHEPELLILDEPMSGLDPIGRKDIRDIISKMAQQGRSVFFSSHVIPDVEAICTQVGILHQGKLLEAANIDGLLGENSFSTEVGFSHAGKEILAHFEEISPIKEGFRAVFHDQKKLQSALKFLLEKNATILWVSPLRKSLESFFEKKRGSHVK